MSTSSFRARELEALRMELRRELRMEANVFAEDDDFDASDDDDGDDAVVGTPARSRAARRPTAASKGTSRPSSRAFESPSRSIRVDDFKDALSPMRGLGRKPVAEKENEIKRRPKPTPSRRRRDVDVVATPTRSEAPPARSAALADRLVLAPPSMSSRGRDRAPRLGRGDESFERLNSRLRSPSLERLAGTYRSLSALATVTKTPVSRVASERVSSRVTSISSSAAKKTANRRKKSDVPAAASSRDDKGCDDKERPVSRSEDARDARRRTPSSASVSKKKNGRVDAKKEKPATVSDHLSRAGARLSNPTKWRTVVEYDLNGRRVERKVLEPPPSAKGRPAWSSATRPGTSSGAPSATRKTKRDSASRQRPATSSGSGASRPSLARPAFDPGPGGLGIDHTVRARESASSFLTPERERRASASLTARSPETASPVRYRRATPSPAPRKTRETFFSSDDDERRSKRREGDRDDETSEPSDCSLTEYESESESESERDGGLEGGKKRAERRATRDVPAKIQVWKRSSRPAAERFSNADANETETENAKASRRGSARDDDGGDDGGVFGGNPKHPNPFVDVRDDAADDSDEYNAFFSGTGLGTRDAFHSERGDSGRPATARSRVRTPSTSGRRAALGGFEGSLRSAFGYRSHSKFASGRPNTAATDRRGTRSEDAFFGGYRAAPPSSPSSPAHRPYTADTAMPRRNDSNDSSSFDDIINRAFGMAHAPSPSRFAERRYGGDYSGHHAVPDQRSIYHEPQPHLMPQHPAYPHYDAHASDWRNAPASYAAAPNFGAPAYGPPHPGAYYYSAFDAGHRAAPPPTGAAASFQRWSHSTGMAGGGGYY